MMGIDEFLKFKKELTALVKECGIDKYLKMHDERVAYGICQYLQNLWDIMHDRDEWHMFLARMEDPKPADIAALDYKHAAVEPASRPGVDHYTDDEPIRETGDGSIPLETLYASQDLKDVIIVENEPATHDEHLVQVEDELDQKFQELEKRYVKLLGVVESLLSANNAPEKEFPDSSLKESPVPAIQVLDQEPEESFPPLMGFPEEEPEENSIPTFHYLDQANEEESVPAISLADQQPTEESVPAISFPDPMPGEEAVPVIHFPDPMSGEEAVPVIHFPDPMSGEEAVPVIHFPDPMPGVEEAVPVIHFPDPMSGEEAVPVIHFPDPMPGEEAVPVIHFPDPMPGVEEAVSAIHFPDPFPEEDAVPVIHFPDPEPEEDSVSTRGFHEFPFNLESESTPEPEPQPAPEQEPATGFALETDPIKASNASTASATSNLQENCTRIGHPEAGFHISCFKCDKQKECQNSHENQRTKR